MNRLVFGGWWRMPMALLALSTPLFALAPRSGAAQQASADRLVVTLEPLERFQGEIEPVTIMCPFAGTCTGTVRVVVRGRRWPYTFAGSVRGARLSVMFVSKGSAWPPLSFGRDDAIDIALQPGETGARTAALVALDSEYKYPGFSGLERLRIPVANIRVTVRREDDAERNR